MNKAQAVSLAIMALSAATAQAGSVTGGGTSASSVTVAMTVCTGLKEAVNIKLSANNYGVVDCPNATSAGVGVVNLKGAGKSYSASSNGGALAEATTGTLADGSAALAAAQTAAELASPGS